MTTIEYVAGNSSLKLHLEDSLQVAKVNVKRLFSLVGAKFRVTITEMDGAVHTVTVKR